MAEVTRRTALAAIAGAAAAPALARSRLRGRKVAVIGAGLAGLAAAQAAKTAGADVVVLEARDRIGGRLWTSRTWADLPADLGASWIHGVTGNPLSALADRAGLRRVATRYESGLTLNDRGQEIDPSQATARMEALIEAARARVRKSGRDMSLEAAVTAHPAWAAMTADEKRMLRAVVTSTVEHEYGGAWSEVSALHYDAGREFGGGDALFPEGYDQIAQYLAKGLDIRVNSPVAGVAPDAGGVRLSLVGGGTVTAGHAVIAAPLGVLKAGRLRFDEPLARSRQAAVEAMRMGLLNKCWLRFDRVRWPADVDWLGWIGPKDGVWAEWINGAASLKAPVLLGFNAGGQAREIEGLSDAATIASAHEALKAMFGNAFPAPLGGQVTRWAKDPFSLGAYSFNAVGMTPRMRGDLAGADWDGRIAFAGEATSTDYFGTAHGAYLSGRAAVTALGG